MKVVFLDTTMNGSLFGGAHTFLFKIMKGLKERGVEVHFVTQGKPVAKTAIDIDKSGAILHNRLWSKSVLVEDSAPVFAAWLEKLKPDIYVVSVSPDIGWVVLPYLSPSIATFTIGHNDSDTFYDPAKHYASFLTKAIGVSEEICHNYIHKSGIPKDRVEWIPYGVESDKTGPAASKAGGKAPLSLVYVGRLEEEQKRSSDLIRVIHSLVKKQVDFHFKIIGDGHLFSKFEKELATEISQNKVELTGWLKSEELMQYLRQSDIFVLTSAYEGFCISLVEAMANGCCPLVTDIRSGNKQLISDGKNGYLFPVGNIEGFAEKIKWLSTQPEKLFDLRKKAWEVGRQYSIDQMVSAYYASFQEGIISAKKAPRRPDPTFSLMESCRSKYPTWLRRIKSKGKGISKLIKLPGK